jgi:serine/threonine protein kinase
MATWCTPAGFIARFCLNRRAASAVPLPIGEAFARYRIVRLLGSGGVGEVYLVRNPRLCRHDAVKVLPADFPTRLGTALGNTLLQPKHQQRGTPAMVTTRVEAAQYLKDAGGLKLVVFGADGHEVAAMFVQGSVTYDDEEATFIAVAEDGHTVGELFVDEAVRYDENTDAFVIRTAQ